MRGIVSRHLRPSDRDALQAELRTLKAATPFPVLFGGTVEHGNLTLSGFVGTRSTILRNLVIDVRCGVGGRAMAEQRPIGVQGYANSLSITHEYDYQVGAEGIETLLAVPVVVRGRTRGALYGGLRVNQPLSDRLTEVVVERAHELAREIDIRDEVDRRLAMLASSGRVEAPIARDDRRMDAIIESYLALRSIADRIEDTDLEAEVTAVEHILRRILPTDRRTSTVKLSKREIEVLEYASLGCRNAEIAARLSLSVDTVKTYMRNLMGKLDVATRAEAVVEARRHGLLG